MQRLWIVVASVALWGCEAVTSVGDFAVRKGDGGAGASAGGGGAGGSGAGGGGGMLPTYAEVVVGDRPIAYWRFGESMGTVASDEMMAFDGAYEGNYTLGEPALIAGDNDGAVHLGGGNPDLVRVASAGALGFADAFSIEAWVSVDDATFGSIVQVANADVNSALVDGYQLWIQGAAPNVQLTLYNGAVGRHRATAVDAAPPPDTVSYIVARFDGIDTCVFIDGAQAVCNTASVALVASSADMLIGRALLGSLDEVAIYDYALSNDQIAVHYQAGR